jgi:hypothetical protein
MHELLLSLLPVDASPTRMGVAVLAVLALAVFDLLARVRHRTTHTMFACVLGTLLSVGLIKAGHAVFHPAVTGSPYAVALGIVVVIMLWKLLFGPWEVETKAVMLGTFLFWLMFHILSRETPEQRLVRSIAATVALVPAVIWCRMFLPYHRERFAAVLLMFFAGMLSTVPILFYDALVRQGVELHFFLFRIVPDSFMRSANSFVTGQLTSVTGVTSVLLSSYLSYLMVGVIEEGSKGWVLARSGRKFWTSIDDAMQLSIVVGIGFAFAENIVNPTYFMGFVREYLVGAALPDMQAFFSNVLGRSVLTSMVHILSTGVFGYFLGLAVFAEPLLREQHKAGALHLLLHAVCRLLRFPEEAIFRREMTFLGILSAVLLHGTFNFLVTLPDLLPGNPQNIADLLHLSEGSYFRSVPILLVPSLLYVVGGFWLLTFLFQRKANMEERVRR